MFATWWQFGDWTIFLFGAVAVAAAVSPAHLRLDIMGQLIVSLLPGALLYALFFRWRATGAMSAGSVGAVSPMGCFFCVALFSVRLWIRNAAGGRVVNAFILFTCWLFLGLDASTALYRYISGPAVVAILWGAGAGNRLRDMRGRTLGAAAVILTVGAVIGIVFMLGIPRAYNWLETRYFERFAFSATGFSPVLQLGSVNRMFVSNQVVFRVFARPKIPVHLRGVVYNRWNGRFWTNTISARPMRTLPGGENRDTTALEVRMTGGQHRIFVPLNTEEVTANAALTVDSLGIAELNNDRDNVERYGVQLLAPGERPQVLPPVADDSAVPENLRRTLLRWMTQHIERRGPPAQMLSRIQSALQSGYRYSLTFARPRTGDALVDFLMRNPKGHCEYFASAFALLARSVGVPTRVVGGYYLKEYNSMGNYYIVREKHAHVWTEVWLNDRWYTMDPTPPGALATRSKAVSNIADLGWVWIQRGIEALLQLKPWGVALVIAGLLLLWGGIIWHRLRKKTLPAEDALAYAVAHHVFVTLEQQVSAILPRKQSEPLEDWADRLIVHDPAQHQLGSLLMDYAAWRYGGIGDIESIAGRAKQFNHK
jgi:transglutaminase-like putative cysteine protease